MLFSSAYELHNHLSLLNTLTDEVEASINVFAVSVKYWILHQYNCRFVVDVESYWV